MTITLPLKQSGLLSSVKLQGRSDDEVANALNTLARAIQDNDKRIAELEKQLAEAKETTAA